MARNKNIRLEYRSYALDPEFPVLVLSGDDCTISPVQSTRLHIHNCLEIGLCESGSGFMLLGQERVSFQEGDVTFIGQNVSHTTWSAPDSYSRWCYLYLDPLAMLESLPASRIPSLKEVQDLVCNGSFLIKADPSPWAAPLVRELVEEMTLRPMGYRTFVQGLITLFLLKLLRLQRSLPETRGAWGELNALSPALSFIQTHYMQDFSMDLLSEKCHMSPSHFRRQFCAVLGMPPLAYLHHVRILKSCVLLRSTQDSVSFIASKVGYASLSGFNRHFQEILGTTPSTWRRLGPSEAPQPVLSAHPGWTRAESSEEILQKR